MIYKYCIHLNSNEKKKPFTVPIYHSWAYYNNIHFYITPDISHTVFTYIISLEPHHNLVGQVKQAC